MCEARLHLVEGVGRISLALATLTEDPGEEDRIDEGAFSLSIPTPTQSNMQRAAETSVRLTNSAQYEEMSGFKLAYKRSPLYDVFSYTNHIHFDVMWRNSVMGINFVRGRHLNSVIWRKSVMWS